MNENEDNYSTAFEEWWNSADGYAYCESDDPFYKAVAWGAWKEAFEQGSNDEFFVNFKL